MPNTRAVIIGLVSAATLFASLIFLVDHEGSKSLDFVERHLGFSPDGGDGSVEVMFFVVMTTIVVAASLGLTVRKAQ